MAVLAVCAIVRNEAPYLPEWFEHHRKVGFAEFWLYDDYSTDNTYDLASQLGAEAIRWEEQSYIHHRCPERCEFGRTPQVTAFNHWISLNRHRPDLYVAFIDPDEYLYFDGAINLEDALLDEFAAAGDTMGALFVQWLFFGSNGHFYPQPGTRAFYTRRAPLGEPDPYGLQGKIIARADRLAYFGPYGSHNAVLRGCRTFNENGDLIDGPKNPLPSAAYWRLNHYYHRSALEALWKIQRGDRNAVPGYIPDATRLAVCNRNDLQDTSILRFI
jgi:glycosyltransferase involved in cell wall biosynthesis